MIDVSHPAVPFFLAALLYVWGTYGFYKQGDLPMAWTSFCYALANIGFITQALTRSGGLP